MANPLADDPYTPPRVATVEIQTRVAEGAVVSLCLAALCGSVLWSTFLWYYSGMLMEDSVMMLCTAISPEAREEVREMTPRLGTVAARIVGTAVVPAIAASVLVAFGMAHLYLRVKRQHELIKRAYLAGWAEIRP